MLGALLSIVTQIFFFCLLNFAREMKFPLLCHLLKLLASLLSYLERYKILLLIYPFGPCNIGRLGEILLVSQTMQVECLVQSSVIAGGPDVESDSC